MTRAIWFCSFLAVSAVLLSSALPLSAEPQADGSRLPPGPGSQPDRQEVYKKTPETPLKMHIYLPDGWQPGDGRPAIIFFFGGGFRRGSPVQFFSKSEYLASRGMVAISAEYRVKATHGTAADKCVEDARSAMRYLKQHSRELGIDPDRIVAAGGSAGGYLAASLAFGQGPDAPDEPATISPRPMALVLFNPAIISLADRLEGDPAKRLGLDKTMSPIENLKEKAPPAILFFGTNDALLAPARQWCQKSAQLGNRCDLWTAAGKRHGFFNATPWHEATLRLTDEFLVSLGLLKGNPTQTVPEGAILEQAMQQ